MVTLYSEQVSKEVFESEYENRLPSWNQMKKGQKYHLYLKDSRKGIYAQLKVIPFEWSSAMIDFEFETVSDSIKFNGWLLKSGYNDFWFVKKAV